jgi:hypothetical protein
MTISPIDRLLAIEEIRRLKAKYFRYVDTKQWDRFRGLFTMDAMLFFPEAMTKPMSLDSAMDQIVPALRQGTSIHHGHMAEIEVVDHNTATAIWAMEDQVFSAADAGGSAPRVAIGAGHYHESYRREAGEWRIASLKLTRLRLEVRQLQTVAG